MGQSIATAPKRHVNRNWRAHGAFQPEVAIPISDTGAMDVFSMTIGAILDKMESTRTESRALAFQRDALLPKLVSGEVRVADCC